MRGVKTGAMPGKIKKGALVGLNGGKCAWKIEFKEMKCGRYEEEKQRRTSCASLLIALRKEQCLQP